ncbi:MAG: DUF4926 domain-containing protein [Chloroflexi bacterium]|nr:MAG: DUF4926 domain-containing protein [Chloroflexota bacterium]
MTITSHTIVQLVTNRYEKQGVLEGSLGIVLEVYNNEAFEVEFFKDDGTTIDWFAVKKDEIIPYEKPSLIK